MKSEKNCSRYEEEHKKMFKIINFRFPHAFKKIGLISALTIFVLLLSTKFWGSADIMVKDILRTLIVLFLLIASLSKEIFEDEYIIHIRFQSYVLAFICAIVYSICLPLIAYVLEVLIFNITGHGNVSFTETSSFSVIFMLLCFQLASFEGLKKLGRA